MAMQRLVSVCFEKVPHGSNREPDDPLFHVDWPLPSNYTDSIPDSTQEGGFWWINEEGVPDPSRSLFADAANEGAQLYRLLMTVPDDQNTELQKIRYVHHLSLSLIKLLIERNEYNPSIQKWIKDRWRLVRDCKASFCLGERSYSKDSYKEIAAMPLQCRLFSTCERTLDVCGPTYDRIEEKSLVRDLEKWFQQRDPEDAENKVSFLEFIEPVIHECFPGDLSRMPSKASVRPQSGLLSTDQDSPISNEYSIFGSLIRMEKPLTPRAVEDILPSTQVSHKWREMYNQMPEHMEIDEDLRINQLVLKDQDSVHHERFNLLQRALLILEHYVVLYTLLNTWWDDAGPGDDNVWSQSRSSGWINVDSRKCRIIQQAAWYIILGTESLWKRCEFHQSVGNFDDNEANSFLPQLKKWMLDMLVVAVSVQVDGWRIHNCSLE